MQVDPLVLLDVEPEASPLTLLLLPVQEAGGRVGGRPGVPGRRPGRGGGDLVPASAKVVRGRAARTSWESQGRDLLGRQAGRKQQTPDK